MSDKLPDWFFRGNVLEGPRIGRDWRIDSLPRADGTAFIATTFPYGGRIETFFYCSVADFIQAVDDGDLVPVLLADPAERAMQEQLATVHTSAAPCNCAFPLLSGCPSLKGGKCHSL